MKKVILSLTLIGILTVVSCKPDVTEQLKIKYPEEYRIEVYEDENSINEQTTLTLYWDKEAIYDTIEEGDKLIITKFIGDSVLVRKY
jgi:hypothetical protein